jgi:hypothetical protein
MRLGWPFRIREDSAADSEETDKRCEHHDRLRSPLCEAKNSRRDVEGLWFSSTISPNLVDETGRTRNCTAVIMVNMKVHGTKMALPQSSTNQVSLSHGQVLALTPPPTLTPESLISSDQASDWVT